MEIRTVGVLGCGLMGSGIAQVSAVSLYRTIVREVDDASLGAGLDRIRASLDEGVKREKVSESTRATALSNLYGTTTFEALKDCDVIVEAIVENLDEKRATYAALEPLVRPHTI